jgi:predicted nucleic acid-binding protein
VRSLARLDELTRELLYVPITTATWRRAAALWAAARNAGNLTAPAEALDGDVLIAAQALEESAVVLTTNAKHFELLSVQVLDWSGVPLP